MTQHRTVALKESPIDTVFRLHRCVTKEAIQKTIELQETNLVGLNPNSTLKKDTQKLIEDLKKAHSICTQ